MAVKKTAEKIQMIRADLIAQLESQNKYGKHFEDLIEDYLYYLDLKDKLQRDINHMGLRVTLETGNGFKSQKPNESIQNVLKVSATMMKLLSELGLKEPVIEEKNGDEEYL